MSEGKAIEDGSLERTMVLLASVGHVNARGESLSRNAPASSM